MIEERFVPSQVAAREPMTLPRYERPRELDVTPTGLPPGELIPYEQVEARLADAPLSPGSRALLLGLLRTGTTKVFPGGGVGIEYGSLLKTAVRPDDLGRHVREVAEHLMAKRVDLLLVPGMSGYPVGAMYALAANIPALLLKKQNLVPSEGQAYPAGSFAIPSYTGDGDVVMSADLEAAATSSARSSTDRSRPNPPPPRSRSSSAARGPTTSSTRRRWPTRSPIARRAFARHRSTARSSATGG